MQYDELLRIVHFLEKDYDKQKSSRSGLLKEIKRLNETMDRFVQQNDQLAFEFKTLKRTVEDNLKRQEKILANIERQA